MTDWVSQLADDVIAEAERRAPGKTIVCASGLSPSGPIHLGNLREVMTPHLVADEIRRRGLDCVHLLSWDDYDRFRKVPVGIPEEWAEHIGKPLTSVPAPPGSAYPNWAEHFKTPMISALARLGVTYRGVSQTKQYTSGVYREQILHAMRERDRIDAVLSRFRTKAKPKAKDADEAAALEGSGAAEEEAGYYPYKPYCALCGAARPHHRHRLRRRDDRAGLHLRVRLRARPYGWATHDRGKLVWKVDWPMRWDYRGRRLRALGRRRPPLAGLLLRGRRPSGRRGVRRRAAADSAPAYAFVGISGMRKMSSSKGGVPTAADALEIIGAPLLRWIVPRAATRPAQSLQGRHSTRAITAAYYDRWDALERKVRRDECTALARWTMEEDHGKRGRQVGATAEHRYESAASGGGWCRTGSCSWRVRSCGRHTTGCGERGADAAGSGARARPRRPGHRRWSGAVRRRAWHSGPQWRWDEHRRLLRRDNVRIRCWPEPDATLPAGLARREQRESLSVLSARMGLRRVTCRWSGTDRPVVCTAVRVSELLGCRLTRPTREAVHR
ncbi:hypothetical protein [Nonomuraea dietziae]|uniref:hypothetical protein n=1 Tax=Nonomuraea dietziae TaxID=65515 RepID=UPI0031CFB55B